MADRLDAISGIKSKSGKTYWTRVGTAFKSKNGEGYTLWLDYLPLNRNEDGKMVIALTVPRDRDAPQDSDRRQSSRTQQRDMDDEVPF